MGMNLGAYVKVSEKRYDFAPGDLDLRASQPVRMVLNKVLAVDFSKADTEHFSWAGTELDAAVTKLEANATHLIIHDNVELVVYKEILYLFRECQRNGYTVSLV